MYMSCLILSVSNLDSFFSCIVISFFLFPSSCHEYLEEEISNMRKELEKYGIQMPSFSKIGGILANELSVDEAACKFPRLF